MTNTRRLVETALLIAIAVILSLFKPFELPFGGGITIASMLPIVLIAYRYGTKWGVFSAFVFSIFQMLTGFHTVSAFFMPGDNQMVLWKAILVCLLDYVIAYSVLGFGGIFRNKFKSPVSALCVGSIVVLSFRFIIHFISGSLFFGAWAEWFFTQESIANFGAKVLQNMSGIGLAMFYSLCYNASYMIPEIIITAIVAVIIAKIPVIRNKIN